MRKKAEIIEAFAPREALDGYKSFYLVGIGGAGTHGKTTTTGMLGAGLRAAELDPTIVVGAAVPEFGGPIIEGKGSYAVVEACEAYESYRDLDPFIVLLTNLELDHVDFHGTYESLRESVLSFINRIPGNGCLVFCADDIGARDVASRFSGRKLGYSRRSFERRLAGINGP